MVMHLSVPSTHPCLLLTTIWGGEGPNMVRLDLSRIMRMSATVVSKRQLRAYQKEFRNLDYSKHNHCNSHQATKALLLYGHL